ncbi:MAG: carbon-nitrogen hydrolase family protein [Gammaproteobacteria bacterium]
MSDQLRVGLGQIAPVFLDREATLAKVCDTISDAAAKGCHVVGFGEALVPGYPFWPERTGGAVFNSSVQKEFHARYLDQAVQIEAGHLDRVSTLARELGITVVLGIIERPSDRGGHSVYASAVTINARGEFASVHRKLMPTYEERLTWSPGDGHGLRVHSVGAFTLGSLNCWENWMPLPRASLYALGEDLHYAIWPGGMHNTQDITRFIAKEARSYVVSVSSVMRGADFPAETLCRDQLVTAEEDFLADGGSCVAGPDGEWVLAPVPQNEGLLTADIDHARVREERQNFDPVGHYSRPDVTQLHVDRRRQSTLQVRDD